MATLLILLVLIVSNMNFYIMESGFGCNLRLCSLNLFNVSWFFIAVIYYFIVLGVFLFKHKHFILKQIFSIMLLTGLVFHFGLIVTGYVIYNEICRYCLAVFCFELLLCYTYFIVSNNGKGIVFGKDFNHRFINSKVKFLILIIVFLFITANAFAVNKLNKSSTIERQVIDLSNENNIIGYNSNNKISNEDRLKVTKQDVVQTKQHDIQGNSDINNQKVELNSSTISSTNNSTGNSTNNSVDNNENINNSTQAGYMLSVRDKTDKIIELDLTKEHVLLVSPTCPACEQVLKQLNNSNKTNKAKIVFVYSDNKILIESKLSECGFSDDYCYYILDHIPFDIKGVPSLVRFINNKLVVDTGVGIVSELINNFS